MDQSQKTTLQRIESAVKANNLNYSDRTKVIKFIYLFHKMMKRRRQGAIFGVNTAVFNNESMAERMQVLFGAQHIPLEQSNINTNQLFLEYMSVPTWNEFNMVLNSAVQMECYVKTPPSGQLTHKGMSLAMKYEKVAWDLHDLTKVNQAFVNKDYNTIQQKLVHIIVSFQGIKPSFQIGGSTTGQLMNTGGGDNTYIDRELYTEELRFLLVDTLLRNPACSPPHAREIVDMLI